MNHTTTASSSPDHAVRALDARFEAMLPAIRERARFAFRSIRCRDTREDRTADVIALCWRWYRMLVQSGRSCDVYASALAKYAVRSVRAGRRAQGKARVNGVMYEGRKGADAPHVVQLGDAIRQSDGDIREALRDNTVSPVPEQVVFRVDFPAFLGKLSSRNAAMAIRLMEGHRTGDVAQKFGVSACVVSQLRRQLAEQWNAM